MLYLLRLKRRGVTVSTHLFWQRVLQESSRRAFFHRLRHLLSLLLHLLIFLLIVGALARPMFRDVTHDAGSTVLLIDTRARMQAIEPDGQSRFAKAIDLARTYARQANAHTQFALVAMDRTANVAVPFTDDERALASALDKLTPTDAPGDLAEGLELAHAFLAGKQGERRIVVFTDRPLPPDAKYDLPLTVHALGSPRENAAITRFAARPHPANPETAELLLEVQNFGTQPLQTELELQFDGRPFEVKPLNLSPGEKRVDVFSRRTAPRSWLARLADCKSQSLRCAPYRQHGLCCPPLASHPPCPVGLRWKPLSRKAARGRSIDKVRTHRPAAWKTELAAKFEVTIFDKFVPKDFAWEAAAGNFLFPRHAILYDERRARSASDHRNRRESSHHPQRQPAEYRDSEATPLAVPPARDGWTFATPLRSFEHPLLVTATHSQRRIATLAFDVLESDLPLRVAFPLLITNALQWLDARDAGSAIAVAGGGSTLTEAQSASTEPLLAAPKNPPTTQAVGDLSTPSQRLLPARRFQGTKLAGGKHFRRSRVRLEIRGLSKSYFTRPDRNIERRTMAAVALARSRRFRALHWEWWLFRSEEDGVNLSLSYPWFFVALAALPLLVLGQRRSLAAFTPAQRKVCFLLRTLILLCLVFALVGLRVFLPSNRDHGSLCRR